MINNIILGAVGGCAYALSGLVNKDKREKFDWKKMLPTVLIGLVVGGIAGFTGQDYGMIANTASAAGITVVVEKVFKGLFVK